MIFFSTQDRSIRASFREAVIRSLPSDNGLYYPERLPALSSSFLSTLADKTLPEVAFEVLQPFCAEDVPAHKLQDIVSDTFVFDIPLKSVTSDTHCLELFHGPTMAFKDVGARFLARTLSYFQENEDQETTILVATSGDTGGAVASGFYNQPGVNVVILYPTGKVTPLQERQMTTLGGNIRALEITGDFDDCQAMVKKAFLDEQLTQTLKISSANSINIARWLPQSIYYFVPFMQELAEKVVFSVPSGNYGNLTSGMLAKKMGLPIHHFIAASNANDVVPRFLKNGKYLPKETIQTLSNAMDVSKPSNFTRLETLYDHSYAGIVSDTTGFSLQDAETLQAIQTCHQTTGYLMDPHSAIAYTALQHHKHEGAQGVFLGTAHHCKFMDVMEKALDESLQLPAHTLPLFEKEKHALKMENDYSQFKEYLLNG